MAVVVRDEPATLVLRPFRPRRTGMGTADPSHPPEADKLGPHPPRQSVRMVPRSRRLRRSRTASKPQRRPPSAPLGRKPIARPQARPVSWSSRPAGRSAGPGIPSQQATSQYSPAVGRRPTEPDPAGRSPPRREPASRRAPDRPSSRPAGAGEDLQDRSAPRCPRPAGMIKDAGWFGEDVLHGRHTRPVLPPHPRQ